ncbi:hypothetical protein DSAG12_04285 [Promethearchaeum syntrophicum]|uniref:Uncharacterized protein n=1 Tax=Promethearchaeum syntrophicum TaxID=2594042 RepID=A0AC61ZU03_9ARCH|nr:hypothetical protein [Candidatus Prometheoarchaeum syntrophicum]
MVKKQSMSKKASKRIQSAQDRKGSKGDQGFKARAQRAASKNSK